MTDPLWQVPPRPVEAAPATRITPIAPEDKGPMPPDDPAANAYMHHVYRYGRRHNWRKQGELASIEDPSWADSLPRAENGDVSLDQGGSVQLALLNSRDYQDQVERLYLAALGLTLDRFEFDLQWNAGNTTFFEHFGAGGPPNETNSLRTDSGLGFSKAFAAGGQLIVNFANSFAWQFTGGDFNMASGGLLVSFTQPLLRGAFKRIRLESLTLAERQVLYAVRDFARFRQIFYVNVASGQGFLGLLRQLQAIRNQRANVVSLERNLREHEELYLADMVSQIQVDLVYQQLQNGQLDLANSENGLQTSLDAYKTLLGLPPELPVQLDDSLLSMFELNSPRLDALRQRVDEFHLRLLQPDEPPPENEAAAAYQSLIELQKELAVLMTEIDAESQQWIRRLEGADSKSSGDGASESGRERFDQPELARALSRSLAEQRAELEKDIRDAGKALENLATTDSEESWDGLLEMVGERLRERVADAFITQTQIRVFAIELTPVELEQTEGIELALENRMDLMNAQGVVVDAWRNVQVAANALKADIDLTFDADIRTDPGRDNPIRFDASASRYRVGAEFDSPLNRRSERNAYRRGQVRYQQARRDYMANRDGIVAAVRRDLRDLETRRVQFEIARRQLLVAVRQVDEAEIRVRTEQDAQGNSSLTRDLLNALNSLLGARDTLIVVWVNYETSRMNVYRDMGLMNIDAQGEWTDEFDDRPDENARADDPDAAEEEAAGIEQEPAFTDP